MIASPRQRLATFDLAIRPWVIVVHNVLPRRRNEPPCGRAIRGPGLFDSRHFHAVLDSCAQTMVSVTH